MIFDTPILLFASFVGVSLLLNIVLLFLLLRKNKSTISAIDNSQSMIDISKLELSNKIEQGMNSNTKVLEYLTQSIQSLNTSFEQKTNALRESYETKMFRFESGVNDNMEKIRLTVDEKLHETLEKRLSDTFRVVADRLETVHRGIGEMQSIAGGVSDLKKILSNVKTRGVWGEVQLENILEQMMAPSQFIKNASVKKSSQEKVEFAIILPNKGEDEATLLPIDSKLPLDVYQKLVDAMENVDLTNLDSYKQDLANAIKTQAKLISSKYINPPNTTEYAIMFLPIEGLYAETLKIPGLMENILHNHKIIVAGPTTLSAILVSLQVGYKAVAIHKRSSEIWKILAVVRKEFVKFSDLLGKTRSRLDLASRAIGEAEGRSQKIQKTLSNLEQDGDMLTDNLNDAVLPEAK